MFERLVDILKANPRKIVFTEGPDARILEAADRLMKEDLMDVILATTSRGWRSLTRLLIRKWTPWSKRWSPCARAR